MQDLQERARSGSWGRRLAIVAPATLALTVGLGTASALAAPPPVAAAAAGANGANGANGHGAPNLGVGQDKSAANAAHAPADTSDAGGTSTAAGATAPADPGASSAATDHGTAGTAATVGDAGTPQPLSTADKNGGGANGQCTDTTAVYCSTRGHGTGDAQPSLNGNGDGQATGKPCEACVGKADNKNPPGQEKADPMGTFPNNGYECDHNNGIGKGNPAHSGCTGAVTTCPTGEVMDSTGQCTTPVTATCPTGQVMNDHGKCVTPHSPGCPSGQVMDSNGQCGMPATASCPTGQVMNEGGVCHTPGTLGTPGTPGTPVTPGTPAQVGGTSAAAGSTAAPGEDVLSCGSGQLMVAGTCTAPASTELCGSGEAMADGTCVLGEKVTRTAAPGATAAPAVLGERVVKAPTALPFTGANVNGLLASGVLFALMGLPLLVAGRRRRSA